MSDPRHELRSKRAKIKDLIGYWVYYGQLRLDLDTFSAIVPRDQMVCFNAWGDYILVEHGRAVWSSQAFWNQVYGQTPHHGPPRRAEDPKPDVKMEYEEERSPVDLTRFFLAGK